MSTFVRELSLPPLPEGTQAVHLVFNLTRARLLPLAGSELRGFKSLPHGAMDLDPRAFPNVISVGVEHGVHVLEGGRRSLVLHGQGEPAELVRVVARTSTHLHVLRAESRTPCLSDGDLLLTHAWQALAPVATPGGLLFGPSQYQADLEVALAALPILTADEALFKRRATYFARLNALTDGKLNDFLGALQTALNQHIANTFIGTAQRQRHALRELRAAAGLPAGTPLSPFDSGTFETSVREVAQAFELARVHAAMSLDEVRDAFLAFAQGALRIKLPNLLIWTTQPSSGLFFLFGEFALLAHECAVGPDWLPMARSLCLARELYVEAYPPDKAVPLDAGAYTACSYSGNQAAAERLERLKAEFDALDYTSLVRRSAEQTELYLHELYTGP